VELRQYLEDDVAVAEARRAVEGEVRPEAVRVREQRTLRLPGRPPTCRREGADRRREPRPRPRRPPRASGRRSGRSPLSCPAFRASSA
jgi:hypothetical protein